MGKSLPLDNYCSDEYVSAGNKLFIYLMVVEKNVTLFRNGKIIGLHQAKKITKDITETTKIGFRTVQCVIKTWKDSGELSSWRKKCGWEKSWMIVIIDHLNSWWNEIVKTNSRTYSYV